MSNEIMIKVGDALMLDMQFYDDAMQPVDLDTLTIKAQVRDDTNRLIADLDLVKTDTLGLATAQVLDTWEWPVGLLRCDALVTQSGIYEHSQTFTIRVSLEVTQR